MRKRKTDRDGLFERPNSPYYWATYTDARGRRVRRSTGVEKSKQGVKEAKALLAKWKLEAHRCKHWDEAPEHSFDELLLMYIKSSQPRLRAPERDLTSARRLKPFFSGMAMSEITGRVVSEYIATRRNDVGPGTINKEIGLLSRAINWARIELDWELNNPVQGRRLREPRGRVRWITHSEAVVLVHAAQQLDASPYLVDFIRLGLHTGMRKGEMLKLQWNRVDLGHGLIYLGEDDQKNGRVSSVPLNSEAREAVVSRGRFVTKHCPGAEWVFCRRDGTRIQNLKRSFKTACTNAGIEDFHPHDMRHTCAAWLVQAGVPIREVAELLRHRDIQMTMRYAHLAPATVHAAVTKIEAITSHSRHTSINEVLTSVA